MTALPAQNGFAVTPEEEAVRCGYAGARRGIDWPAAALALGLQALILLMLLSLGIVGHTEKRERLTVLSMQERSEEQARPSTPQPAKPEVKPVVTPQPKTDVIAPVPKVNVATNPPPIQAATEKTAEPAPPVAVAVTSPAPAAPAGNPGPVKVANLTSNLLSSPPPTYPKSSRSKREEGTVVLRLVVGPDGRVVEISVSTSSGFPALDDAALTAVRRWRWSPTMRDGRAVSISGLVRIPFELKKS